MGAIAGLAKTGKQVFATFSDKNVTFMAGGIAYSAFVSLAPTLLLLLFVVTTLGGGLEGRVLDIAQNSLPGPIYDVVEQFLGGDDPPAGASIVGLVALIWGTLKVFRGLDTAFSEIYETEAENSFVDQLSDGIVVLVALVVSVIATVAASSVFATLTEQIPFLGFFTPVVLVAGLTLAFLPMYYRFPDTVHSWREVLPGAILAAVGWAALQGLFQVYVLFKGDGTGSFFGGVIVVVTWLYFSGLVLLLAAVVNAVRTGHAGDLTTEATSDTEMARENTLTRDELGNYLTELKEQVAGRYEGMQAAVAHTNRPIPNGPVEVTEREVGDDEYAVEIRWEMDEERDR